MQINIKSDLSKLTTIDEASISRIFDKVIWCIADAATRAVLSEDNQIDIDLGFGYLSIAISDSQIKYKFKPSAELEKALVNTLETERNPLEFNLEKSLISKITNIYKDMF